MFACKATKILGKCLEMQKPITLQNKIQTVLYIKFYFT